MIHGLYSRRLRTCSPECPQWNQCPAAGPDVAQLDPVDRPTCPYEQTEYNAALTDCLAILHNVPRYNGFMRHLAHNMALLQVMLGRAAVSMRGAECVDEPPLSADNVPRPNAPRPRPSAKLQAFLRIQSELRRTYQMLVPKEKGSVDASNFEERSRYRRSLLDDNPAIESNADRDHWDYVPPGDYDAALYKCAAAQNSAACDHQDAIDCFTQACKLSTEAGHERKDEIIAAWKPHNGGMTQQQFTQKINELLPP
jgi:hypothetical protein